MDGWTILWLIALIAFVVAEFASFQLISIWFAVGSLVALVISALGFPWWVQVIAFLVVSAVLVLLTRPFLEKIQKKVVPTNSELDVGKTATVIDAIDNEKNLGRVNLNGVHWSARSANGAFIPEGTSVTVDKVDGAKLIVSAVEKQN